ncbi:hypothetical protein ACA572_15295 [Lactiplantibacillus plantarum]
MSSRDTANVLWFDELHREDVNLVGGKNVFRIFSRVFAGRLS